MGREFSCHAASTFGSSEARTDAPIPCFAKFTTQICKPPPSDSFRIVGNGFAFLIAMSVSGIC
jgi:hypothetical protein